MTNFILVKVACQKPLTFTKNVLLHTYFLGILTANFRTPFLQNRFDTFAFFDEKNYVTFTFFLYEDSLQQCFQQYVF